MLKEFKEFYGSLEINPEEIDDSTLICFDANVLLHIYRYSDETRSKLFEAILKVKDNVFVPYHAALEFNLNKKKVLYKSLDKELNTKNSVMQKSNSFIEDICNLLNEIGIRSNDEKPIRDEIKEKLRKDHKKFIDDWIELELTKEFNLIKELDESDEISNRLAELLDGKVGASYKQEDIDRIEQDGIERYSKNIPPGYKDDTDPNKQDTVYYGDISYTKKYGDLIVWNQIIDKILEINKLSEHDGNNKKINKVILITDDAKEDWAYRISGHTKGVRAELRKELLDKTGAYLHVKNTNGFLKLVLELEEKLIQDESFENVEKDLRNFIVHNFSEVNKLNSLSKKHSNLNNAFSNYNKSNKYMNENYNKYLESFSHSNYDKLMNEYRSSLEKYNYKYSEDFGDNINVEKNIDSLNKDLEYINRELDILSNDFNGIDNLRSLADNFEAEENEYLNEQITTIENSLVDSKFKLIKRVQDVLASLDQTRLMITEQDILKEKEQMRSDSYYLEEITRLETLALDYRNRLYSIYSDK